MDYYIKTDHNVMRAVTIVIEKYVSDQGTYMKTADAGVKAMLAKGWIGEDASAFADLWAKMEEKGSATIELRDALTDYANRLAYCAREYINAQQNAHILASSL